MKHLARMRMRLANRIKLLRFARQCLPLLLTIAFALPMVAAPATAADKSAPALESADLMLMNRKREILRT